MNLRYANKRRPGLEIEFFTLEELLRRAPKAHFQKPQRLAFHLLIECLRGRGIHSIDFEDYKWSPGTVFHIRPRQVQQFHLHPEMAARLILFTPTFLSPDPGDFLSRYSNQGSECAVFLDSRKATHRRISEGLRAIEQEYLAIDGSLVARRLLHHHLHAVLLGLLRLSRAEAAFASPDASYRLYYQFLDVLDTHHKRTRHVRDYAGLLARSSKTLARACIAVTGLPPKQLIEQRVALEAKRLLVHTQHSVKLIATELGFSEETNFAKFFRKREGTTPSEFRATWISCNGEARPR